MSNCRDPDWLCFVRDRGDLLLARWKSARFDPGCFPGLAARWMRELFPLETPVTGADIASWLLSRRHLPLQRHALQVFSDCPIVLADWGDFYLEAFFWSSDGSAIHDHPWAGAFALLEGSVLEQFFAFEPAHRHGEGLLSGHLSLKGQRLMAPGQVSAVRAGSKFIHRTVHLARPGVTLAVKSRRDWADSTTQYEYRESQVALRVVPDAIAAQQIRVLVALSQSESSPASLVAADLLRGWQPNQHTFMRATIAIIAQDPLNDALTQTILDICHSHLPELAGPVARECAQAKRRAVLASLSGATRSAAGRLILALLGPDPCVGFVAPRGIPSSMMAQGALALIDELQRRHWISLPNEASAAATVSALQRTLRGEQRCAVDADALGALSPLRSLFPVFL